MAARMVQEVYTCKQSRSKDPYKACAIEFAKQASFAIIETLDDGNCFFDTLSKAGHYYHIATLQSDHTVLRATLVQYMMEHIEEIMPYFVSNNNNNNNVSPFDRIMALGEDGAWDNKDGDILSQVAGDAFHININLYDIKENETKRGYHYTVNKITFANYNGSPTINILRINDGHYEFLQPLHKKKNNNTRKSNNTSDIKERLSSYTISQLKELMKSIGIHLPKSITKKDNIIEHIIQNIGNTGVFRTTLTMYNNEFGIVKKKKNTKKNNNLAAAIEASLRISNNYGSNNYGAAQNR